MKPHITIEIPENFQYLGPYLRSIGQEYDLPHNAYIMKGMTGVGGTTIALDNDEKYVIACHTTALIREKCNQPEYLGKVLPVTSETKDEDIMKFVVRGGKKIMITYDSVPRLDELIDTKSFRLLVDEVQQLIKYLGGFKTQVCLKLLKSGFNYKSTSFMTATSTSLEYLPPPLLDLNIVEYNWKGSVKPQIKKCQVKSNMSEKILAFSLDVLDNSKDEIYLFYNSRFGATSFIKKLLKTKPRYTLNDINLMFSNTIENTEFFKKHLGKDFEYGCAPNGTNNKRINLISSMGFEGIDFYPNKDTNINPITLIVSDPKSKSMRYDISVDIVQIIGRFRADKETGTFPKNNIFFMWNTYTDTLEKSKDDYESDLLLRILNTEKLFDQLIDNPMQKEALVALAEKQVDNITLLEDPHEQVENKKYPIMNPYAYHAAMSVYESMHNDYKSMSGFTIDVISNRLDSIAETDIFEIPVLSAEYTKLLGRQPALKKICTELEQIEIDMVENRSDNALYQELVDEYNALLILHPQIKEWIDSGMNTDRFRALSYTKEKIQQEYARRTVLKNNEDLIDVYLKFKKDEIYSREDIISKLSIFYTDLNIDKKVKATDIQEWYNIKSVTVYNNGSYISGYKILDRITE